MAESLKIKKANPLFILMWFLGIGWSGVAVHILKEMALKE